MERIEGDLSPGLFDRTLTRLAIAFAIAKFAIVIFFGWSSGALWHPPERGDGHDYEMIAYSIWTGHGIGYNWSDPAWRAPYELANLEGGYSSLLARSGDPVLTAYRPPLYPMFIALVYSLYGRDFLMVRLFQGLAVAMAFGLLVLLAGASGGRPVAWCTGILGLLDTVSIVWTLRFVAEPLTLLGVVALIWCCVLMRYSRSQSQRYASVVGFLLGLLVLLKNALLFFVPMAVGICFLRCQESVRIRCRECLFLVLFFFAASFPWALRNSLWAGEFVPFGTQGGVNFAYDYSDLILRSPAGVNDGALPSAEIINFLERAHPEVSNSPGIVAEQIINQSASTFGTSWLLTNYPKLPELMWSKIASLWWRDLGDFSRLLVMLSFLGLFARLRYRAEILLPCLGVSLLVVVMHNVSGERFALLMFPSLWILGGAGLGNLLELLSCGLGWKSVGSRQSAA